MKVSLEKHGGQLAGVYLNRPPRSIDTNHLPSADAKRLSALAAAASAEASRTGSRKPEVGETGSGRTVPDGMSYTITIDDGGRAVVLEQTDVDMTAPFQDLLRWIETHDG